MPPSNCRNRFQIPIPKSVCNRNLFPNIFAHSNQPKANINIVFQFVFGAGLLDVRLRYLHAYLFMFNPSICLSNSKWYHFPFEFSANAELLAHWFSTPPDLPTTAHRISSFQLIMTLDSYWYRNQHHPQCSTNNNNRFWPLQPAIAHKP